MAGRPRAKRILEDLTLKALAELGDDSDTAPTALDFVTHYLANGGTMLKLAYELQEASGDSGLGVYDPPLSGETIRRAIYREFGDEAAGARMSDARVRGSHAMVEQTHEIADEAVHDPADGARARNRIASRQWAATAYDRNQFGNRGNQVNVQINVPSLHLDALRQRAVANVIHEPTLLTSSSTES